ncbi:diguanylate cyclase (plasmid) [Deinococcus taeanensis]|uniref:GAF domain-containing protein n=1 Tax=Deinococcus taeanensis TaxID=2737050 RepID=UPI001CDD6846|nr:GAF domain-containing protein [Deinococcus taeanensis]UBV44857.1 diguanylate cyclase [Deinococcus taeanensis]
MSGAPVPASDSERLMALAYYGILDTPPEPQFDRITRLAAHILGTPVATINFVDQFRQWSKSSVGLPNLNAPRQDSFCAWTILDDQPFVIEDASADPRFRNNPLVTGDPHIHMYAGAPLIMPSGQRIGTLCVTDHRPHPVNDRDLQVLKDLADMVVTELELRAYQQRLSLSLEAQREHSQELQRTLQQASVLDGVSQLVELNLDVPDTLLAVAGLLGDALDADHAGLITVHDHDLQIKLGHVHPRAAASLPELSARAPAAARRLALHRLSLPRFIDDLSHYAAQRGQTVSADVAQAAVIPVGSDPTATYLLFATRLRDHAVPGWRGRDRNLLEAAGRTVRAMLDRRLAAEYIRHDALTGVLNRRSLDQDLNDMTEMPFTLTLLGLDGLRDVNDLEGHSQGDKLLRIFGAALAAELDTVGRVYRYTGDQFVLLTDPTTEDRLMEYVDTALLATRQVSPLVGVSAGTVQSSEPVRDTLLLTAEARLAGARQRRAERLHA